MKYLIALSYFVFFCTLYRAFGKINARTFLYGVAMLFLLASFAAFNDSFGFIEEKVASFVSYDIYKGEASTLTFIIQYILLWVPFELFDYEYSAHGMNMALQAFIFMLGAQYIFNHKLSWALAIFTFYPSYLHYSIFGLRDPLINLTTMLVCIAAIKLDAKTFCVFCVILAAVSVGIRPEFSMILLGFGGLRVLFEVSGWRRFVVVVGGLMMVYLALLVMPVAFGIPSSNSVVTNIESMVQFNELRNSRRLGDYGSGSHILGGALFSYPFAVRYPIQIAASFVTPLPFEIRGTIQFLAFLESILFCFAVYMAFKNALLNRTARFIFCCAIIYMLLQALFAINYGNILRVRYPCLILFLTAAVVIDRDRFILRKKLKRISK